jgi:hypothetical protein
MSLDEFAAGVKLSSELNLQDFVAEIVDARPGKDRYGRKVLKLYVKLDNSDDTYVISLPPSLARDFAKRALEYGFKTVDDLKGTRWYFKRVNPKEVVGLEGHDRYVPVSFVCTREWLEKRYGDKPELLDPEVADIRRMCWGDVVNEWLRDNYVMVRQKGTIVYQRKK